MKNIKYNIIQLLVIIYLIFCIFISPNIDNNIFNFYINPIILIVLMMYSFIYTENSHGRFENLNENMKSVLIATLLYLILYFLSGLIFGYAKSIYSHELLSIIKNIWQFIIPIISIEYIRSFIINGNKKNYLFIIIFTIIFIMIEVNYFRFLSSINDREDMFKYISSIILPLIFNNILYTYLTIKGSYKLVLIFRVIIEFTYLLVPIFPDFDWFVTGIVGILTPGIIYIFLRTQTSRKIQRVGKKRQKENSIIYIPIILLIILFVCFMVGIFKYEPIAILSDSMNPAFYKGDVVIYRKVDSNELKNIKKYNIIVYSKEGQAIVHRVVRKYEKNKELYFVTKGDANFSEDLDPVDQDNVIGVYEFHIKYIGYPSVWINRFFKYEKAKVEIK